MSLARFRSLFPVTAQKIYLNHAAISPLSIRVTDQVEAFLDERSFGAIDNFKAGDEIRARTRQLIADLINARPEQIAFIQNTSEGFNHLVNGLSWQPGDEVILNDFEFPSNIYPFMNLERFGVKMVFVPNRNGQILVEDIAARITDKTRLLSISFVEFANGYRNDLQAIGELCRKHDIIFSVDGIQGVGALPLDVQKFQIDFLSNGGHKWLMGMMGAGFMYIAPRLLERLRPAFTGWLAVENAWDFFDYRLDLLPDAKRYEYATANFLGIVALNAAVGLLSEAGIANIEAHLLGLGERLVRELGELGLKFQGAEDRRRWSGIYTFAGPRMEKLFEYLTAHNMVCSLRNGMLRIAPHFYNTEEEIAELIAEVRRFYRES